MKASPKTVLIVSPQPFEWQVSKRHYAEALANLGHQVFFMEPPTVTSRFKVRLSHVEGMPNVRLVEVGIPLPDRIRFRIHRGPQVIIYDYLMRLFARKISKELPSLDYVISFDNTLFFPSPASFGAKRSALMIMDALSARSLKRVSELAGNVDCVGAIAGFFLDPFKDLAVNTKLFHHGLGNAFELLAKERLAHEARGVERPANTNIRVGLVGNLSHPATAFDQVSRLIQQFTGVIFEFWGPDGYGSQVPQSEASDYLKFLDTAPNVIRHGRVSPQVIAESAERIDAWLACYDYRKDLNADEAGVPNSHKIMEYLATGKVIVSNLFTMYTDVSALLAMMPTPSNDGFADHFSSVMENLEYYNSWELQTRRMQFALTNTYTQHAVRILEELK